MELETINKLYLELSQIATARTEREIDAIESLEWYGNHLITCERRDGDEDKICTCGFLAAIERAK